MGPMFRLYVRPNCGACSAAINYLTAQNVPFETINIGFDPILIAGLKSEVFGSNPIATPVVWSIVSQEFIVGNNPEYMARIIADARKSLAVASDPDPDLKLAAPAPANGEAAGQNA